MIYKPSLGQIASEKYLTHPRYRGVVGHWLFEERGGLTAYDISGNYNDGTLTNGPAWAAGQFGAALNFDGVNDYVNAGSNSVIDNLMTSNPATLSFWMNPATPLDNLIFSKNDGNNTAGWWVENISTTPTNGAIGLRLILVRATTNFRFGVASPTNNVWTHITIVFDGTLTAANQKIYYNGINQTATTSADGTGTHATDAAETLYFGNNFPASSAGVIFTSYKGFLDDIRIYNRALTVEEVWSLYNDPFAEFRVKRQQFFFLKAAAAVTAPGIVGIGPLIEQGGGSGLIGGGLLQKLLVT